MRMSSLSFITKALALMVLVGAAGCTGPLANSTLPAAALGADQARIVLQLPPSRGLYHQLSDVGFVTVRLQSEDHQSTLFAEATKSGTTFVVDFSGLVAGQWNMRTLLFDSASAGNLLFYAQQTETIEVGSVTTTTVAAYEVGTIGGLSPTSALLPDSIEVTDLDGTTTVGAPRSLAVGDNLALHALVNSSVPGTPASDGRVTWETSDQAVASVSSSGRVYGEGPGGAVVLARSVTDKAVVGQFWVAVTSTLVGLWHSWGGGGGQSMITRAPVTTQVFLRLTANGAMTRYDIGSGTFFVGRGSYTATGDWLVVSTTETLNVATGLWAASPQAASGGNRFSVTRDSLEVFQDYGTPILYTRVSEVPLTAVGVDYPTTMMVGDRFVPKTSLTPLTPTFPQVNWISDTPVVATVDAFTGEVRALSEGTFTVVGKSLGSGVLVASVMVTVSGSSK